MTTTTERQEVLRCADCGEPIYPSNVRHQIHSGEDKIRTVCAQCFQLACDKLMAQDMDD